MWKRDESPKPATPAPAPAPATTPAHTPAVPVSGGDFRRETTTGRDNVNIGKSVFIKGELSGSEDLTIEGNVEGRIELKDNTLTIGPNGKIRAEVFAKQVIVLGEVTGNVTASEKVDIRDNGSVDGDVTSPRVAIAEGAHFRGAIDMQRAGQVQAKPAAPAATAAAPAKAGA
jgi:cytoskeletal protein CcmA (bactofilin family)